LSHQIRRIHEHSLLSHVFPGDQSHGQSFLHMDDLVEALYLCIQRRKVLPLETTLLLGEPDVVSFADLQNEFGRLLHGREDWWTVPVPKPFAKLGAWLQGKIPGLGDPFIKPWMIDHADDHYALDVSRAKELLVWEARHSLRETLPRMVAALKADPEGWYRENGL
jgi:nucleoside-diphosphate-sugar epimerase